MLSPADVSAVIVTRGDVDLNPVLNSLPFDDVVVWNNSAEQDVSCYGRFAGVARARKKFIYVQDDDVLVPIPALLRNYSIQNDLIFANKPPAEEWRFLGIGAIFPWSTFHIFDRYLELYPDAADFHRVADVVFAYSHPYRSDWFGYAELEWSRYENRMYKQPDHYAVRERARDRTLALTERTDG